MSQGIDRGGQQTFKGTVLRPMLSVAPLTAVELQQLAMQNGTTVPTEVARILDQWHRGLSPSARCAGARGSWVTVRRSVPACGWCGASAQELAVPRGLFPVSQEEAGGRGWSGEVPAHVSRR